MKTMSKKGFFLIETLVVIGILGIVVTLLFRSFYNLYATFSASEYYNTVSASNAAYNVSKYFKDQNINYTTLIGSNNYIEITNNYSNNYFNELKTETNINKIYLIKPDKVNLIIQNFDVLFRKYLLTLESETNLLIVISTNDGEYGIMRVGN